MYENRASELEALKKLCLLNPYDKELASQYIRAYEDKYVIKKLATYNEDDHLIFLKLKWLHNIEKCEYLTETAKVYLGKSKHRLSFMCLSESLRLNPNQNGAYKTARDLFESDLKGFQIELSPISCMVSVIMPTLGNRDSIIESMRSVLDQTMQDFELIIINDGGDDVVSQIINSFESTKIRYYKFPEHRGLGAALNEGILHARGKYIAYLDDDDVFYPDHLEILTAILDKNTNHALAYSNAWWCFGTREGQKFSERHRKLLDRRPRKFDKAFLFRENYISTLNVLHRKSCFNEVGLFNEGLSVMMDWDMWMRMAMKHEFYQVNRVTGEYRWHQDNMSNRDILEDAFIYGMITRHYQLGCGKLGLAKSHLCQGNREIAAQILCETVDTYKNMSRTPLFIKEVFQLRNRISSQVPLDRITREYFWIESRDCVKIFLERRRILGFLLVLDLFFLKVLHLLTRRCIKWKKIPGNI